MTYSKAEIQTWYKLNYNLLPFHSQVKLPLHVYKM